MAIFILDMLYAICYFDISVLVNMVAVNKSIVSNSNSCSTTTSSRRKILYIVKYIWHYFYQHLVSVLFFAIALIYYVVCIFYRYDVSFTNSFNNFVNSSYESYIMLDQQSFNLSKPSDKLDCLNYINYLIDAKMYSEAVQYIGYLKGTLPVDSEFCKALSIRQALLLFNVAKCAKSYETMLRNTCKTLDSNTVLYLVSLYEKYVSI